MSVFDYNKQRYNTIKMYSRPVINVHSTAENINVKICDISTLRVFDYAVSTADATFWQQMNRLVTNNEKVII